MTFPRYPEATWLGDGREYGPLPDGGYTTEDIRLILHTTETSAMPSYGNPAGSTAPHYTYNPKARRWYGHADLDHRVGTDKSAGNPVSVAVELMCYSDKQVADASSHRLWVGDFTEEMYQDIADFCVWLQTEVYPHMQLNKKTYGPSRDFPSWIYGASAPTRMNWTEWNAFGGGLTSHGASPSGTTHWDTGALDLQRIAALMVPEPPVPPPVPDFYPGPLYCQFGDGRDVQNPELKDAVQFWQQALYRMNLMESPINGEYDERTRMAVKQCRDRKDGLVIDYLQAHWIFRKWMQWEARSQLPPS